MKKGFVVVGILSLIGLGALYVSQPPKISVEEIDNLNKTAVVMVGKFKINIQMGTKSIPFGQYSIFTESSPTGFLVIVYDKSGKTVAKKEAQYSSF